MKDIVTIHSGVTWHMVWMIVVSIVFIPVLFRSKSEHFLELISKIIIIMMLSLKAIVLQIVILLIELVIDIIMIMPLSSVISIIIVIITVVIEVIISVGVKVVTVEVSVIVSRWPIIVAITPHSVVVVSGVFSI